ncbi:hypothetical protein PRJ39_00555 [Lysobacter enzymogenes]|uniref:hypothetical protein n=1 Tax=Lysobacter enzymogenes TaxID=69 RepID=UPI003748821F
MKPPICRLCGRDMLGKLDGGDLVAFADYQAPPVGVAGHPHGAEWFCGEHLAAAREASGLDCAEAMRRLRERYGIAAPSWHD